MKNRVLQLYYTRLFIKSQDIFQRKTHPRRVRLFFGAGDESVLFLRKITAFAITNCSANFAKNDYQSFFIRKIPPRSSTLLHYLRQNKSRTHTTSYFYFGAGDESRTRREQLGKLPPYREATPALLFYYSPFLIKCQPLFCSFRYPFLENIDLFVDKNFAFSPNCYKTRSSHHGKGS